MNSKKKKKNKVVEIKSKTLNGISARTNDANDEKTTLHVTLGIPYILEYLIEMS